MSWSVIVGDALERLRELPAESVQCVVTSPPYWGLRDYGITEQLGLEPTPELYVEHMVEVFREVRRVLRKDGTVWLNLGDSYTSNGFWPDAPSNVKGSGMTRGARSMQQRGPQVTQKRTGLKPKDLVGIPWRVAFALQADGWWLRSDIIWAKPNPMPESVTDRPTKAHEYVFLLTKSSRYFYDADGVREQSGANDASLRRAEYGRYDAGAAKLKEAGLHKPDFLNARDGYYAPGRNLRTVWNIATEPFPQAHFATFPTALVEPCIKAGTSEKGCCPECGAPWERIQSRTPPPDFGRGRTEATGHVVPGHDAKRNNNGGFHSINPQTVGWRPTCSHGIHGDCERCGKPLYWGDHLTCSERPTTLPCTVLDPFAGSGTVGVVACQLGRSFIGIELNPVYAEMAERRIHNEAGLFSVQDS